MKTLTLFLALALVASAQTTSNVSGVTLSGDPAYPIVENRSGKSLLAVRAIRTYADGDKTVQGQLFILKGNGLADGDSAPLGGRGLPRNTQNTHKVASSKLVAAIFGDGEFRGADDDRRGPLRGDSFRGAWELRFQSLREVWQMAQAGDWDKLQAKVDTEKAANLKGEEVDSFGAMAAQRLLRARGDKAAMDGLAYYGLLPASTWIGGAGH